MEVIRDSSDLYQRLFGLVLKWQRTESRSEFSEAHALFKLTASSDELFLLFVNRWMDGPFEELNGESIEANVDEFLSEIFKTLKVFQQREKKAEQEKEKIAGITGQPRDQTKRESPTVILCSTVTEQIKAFKVLLLLSIGLIYRIK